MDVLAKHGDELHLLVTDVMMRDMSGPSLATARAAEAANIVAATAVRPQGSGSGRGVAEAALHIGAGGPLACDTGRPLVDRP